MGTPAVVPSPKGRQNWVLGLLLVVLAMGIPLFMEIVPRGGIEVGLLPRPGDTLVPEVWSVGNWIAGTKGAIGLKFSVQGEGLPPDQPIRLSEGAGVVTGTVQIQWQDEKGLPVGLPLEQHFKDDC